MILIFAGIWDSSTTCQISLCCFVIRRMTHETSCMIDDVVTYPTAPRLGVIKFVGRRLKDEHFTEYRGEMNSARARDVCYKRVGFYSRVLDD